MEQKISRDDRRKQKELDEARKAGNAPAEVDEEGKDINPHIPQYISQAPWYFGSNGPTLKHQRDAIGAVQPPTVGLETYYDRGAKLQKATHYRKGACANCGSMTHKTKECIERPRRVGAKFTNDNIAADEAALVCLDEDEYHFVLNVNQPELRMTFDGKRDRWNGYNPDEYQHVVEEYEKIEKAKLALKAEQLRKEALAIKQEGENPGTSAAKESESDSDDSEEDDKDEKGYTEATEMPGTKIDTVNRMTVRNLRIREDTAKYLMNLDPNSAYYDPKTRTMHSNPLENSGVDPKDLKYAGDNFIKYSGSVPQFAQNQLFAWDAANRGADVSVMADPTKLEILHKSFQTKKAELQTKIKETVLDRYGGQEHLDAPPKELLLAQTENYVEYSKFGRVIHGQEKAVARSKYEEDILIGNHTSVWGSYWRDGKWGFGCCHSLDKTSYCLGDHGKIVNSNKAENLLQAVIATDGTSADSEVEKSLLEQHQAKLKEKAKKAPLDPLQEAKERERKIKDAIRAQEEEEKRAEKMLAMDERDRPYNSALKHSHAEVTEEDMEAYHLKKRVREDPMAEFLSN